MSKTSSLPYIRKKGDKNYKTLSDYLTYIFKAKIRKKIPQHYFVGHSHADHLDYIKKHSELYPYFLKLDIRKFYPSIHHKLLLEELPRLHKKVIGKPPSRRFRKHLKSEIPDFLSQLPLNKGLPVGSCLSYVLSALFLLNLDWKIKNPFLRQVDDYLIFCKKKKEPEKLLRNVIAPELKRLKLKVNEKKLKSGKFYKNEVSFIGFKYYAGYFTIKKEKVESFKKKIIHLTHLTKKRKPKKTIKLMNDKILGFGHYYKHASCKKDFTNLDAFCRKRLRRWLLRRKSLKPEEGNLTLTNNNLEEMGLKSLLKIKERFDGKRGRKSKKSHKRGKKLESSTNPSKFIDLREKGHYHEQKLMLEKLKKLTSLVEKLEKRIEKLEEKL